MKLYILIAFLCLSCFVATINLSAKNKTLSAEIILKKVSAKLSNLKTISYTIEHENNAASVGFYQKRRTESFLDFTSTDKIIGVRYQLDNPEYIYIFNGSDYFFLSKKSKTYYAWRNPSLHDFESAALDESLLRLRNSLPKIIADETVKKSVAEQTLGNKKVYVVEFVTDGKIMNLTGDYSSTIPGIKFTYRLTIDKSTYLPLELYRTNDANSNTEKSDFEYKSAKYPAPAETSWYYSSYFNEYQPPKPILDTRLKIGLIAPDWTLPAFKDDASVSFSQYKGKVVLVEFWISDCGFCVMAVPKLNQIEEKYRDKDFKLLAINDDDSKERIEKFENALKPKYQILYNGGETAKKYGSFGYPSLFLIDKTGKIIYSGGGIEGKEKMLEELIGKSLEQ